MGARLEWLSCMEGAARHYRSAPSLDFLLCGEPALGSRPLGEGSATLCMSPAGAGQAESRPEARKADHLSA